jgi:HAMP domain-containing protein
MTAQAFLWLLAVALAVAVSLAVIASRRARRLERLLSLTRDKLEDVQPSSSSSCRRTWSSG